LPDDLCRKLAGGDLEACAGKAILVCTVDSNGWPHPAMLSYFEVVARDAGTLRLATYKDSTTTGNMRRNGRLTVLIIDERMAYYIKGTARELSREMACSPHNSKIDVHIEEVLADTANEEFEPGVYVASGVTYKRPVEQLPAREILKELLA
jgi:hypothetical protein